MHVIISILMARASAQILGVILSLRLKKLGILISGRGSNMVQIIKETQTGLLKDLANVGVVISNKPKAQGFFEAQKLGVTTQVAKSEDELISCLNQHSIDWVVLAGFMKILSPRFVRHYEGKILNIHPADTKLHQGLHAYRWAYESKRPETSITVHLVDSGIDTGPVIKQASVDLRGASSLEEVEKRGLVVEHQIYSRAIREMLTKGGS